MFEEKNNQFWNEREINYSFFSERWKTTGKALLKHNLENLSIDDLKYIHRELGLSNPPIDDKQNYLNNILISEKAFQLFLVFEFQRKFQKSILDYSTRQTTGTDITHKPFIKLFKLFIDPTTDHLLNIFVYHIWNAASTGTVFNSTTPFPGDFIDQFTHFVHIFAKRLSTKNWYFGKRKVRFIGAADSIFIFDKQTGDKLLQTTSGHKRVKPSKYILLKFLPSSIEIREVRGASKFIAESIKKILESQYSIELIDQNLTPIRGSFGTFLTRLKNSSDSHDEFRIISLKTKRSKLDKGVPIEIDNFSEAVDISKAISELIEYDVIVLENLSDIDTFSVSFSQTREVGKRKTVVVKENEDGTLILSLNSKELKDDERREFISLFSRRFGIGLNIPLDPTDLAANQKSVFKNLLSEPGVNNPSRFKLDAIERLHDIGVLNRQKQFKLKCSNPDCRHLMNSSDEIDLCRDCGSQAIKKFEFYKLEVSERGTRNYIRGIISRSPRLRERTSRILKINRTKFEFYEVEIENQPIFIYLNFKRVSKNLLGYLERSGLPILFINIAKVVNTSDIEQRLFEQIDLSDILIDENAGLKEIEDKLTRLRSYSLDRELRAARSSYDNLRQKINQPQEYSPQEFETDAFNILKKIFPTAYRAGGKYVPEGFVGLEYLTNRKHKRVFEWDCKLARGGNYLLDQSEIDKAWRYIRGTLNSDDLKHFNKKLDHYIIISNSVDPSMFENFAKALNRKKTWIGDRSVVLLSSNSLMELHNQYARYQDEIHRRPNTFYEKFFKLLLQVDPSKGYCNIQSEQISGLFQEIIASPQEFSELDGAGVEEHLRRDED